jgi:signal transduction histidine kinase
MRGLVRRYPGVAQSAGVASFRLGALCRRFLVLVLRGVSVVGIRGVVVSATDLRRWRVRLPHVFVVDWSHVVVLIGLLLSAVYFAVGRGSVAQSVIYDGIAAAAAVGVVIGITRNRPERRRPWLLFAAAQVLFAAGEVTFDVYARVLNRSPPVPSLADGFYLAAYPVIAIGMGALIVGLGTRRRLPGFLDAAIVWVAFALAQWVFLMAQHLNEAGLSVAGRAVALAYPAGDVVLLAGLAAFLVTPVWRTPAYRYLALSLGLLLLADEVYGVSAETYVNGDPVDAGWMMAYTCWAAAALHPSMRALGRRRRAQGRRVSGWQLGLLSAALCTPPAILLARHLSGDSLEVSAVVAAAGAMTLLVLLRVTGIVRELERSRTRERAARAEAEAAQRLLAEQNARLLEVDRLKDDFVAMISHDLRTPLTSIIGFVDLTLQERAGPIGGDQRMYLEVVARSAQRLLRIVEDLLFVARLQSGPLRLTVADVDLAAIVREAVVEAQLRAQKQEVTVALELEPIPLVLGDPGRLSQLLDNLLSNAIKFTPEGGRITVRLEPASAGVRLEVADTGIGIPPDELPGLFERFVRASTATERQLPGTGLGLYIARSIVEAHNGTIGVESTPGVGTRFRIELPAAVREDLATAERLP